MLSMLTMIQGSQDDVGLLKSALAVQQALDGELLVACPAVETIQFAGEALAAAAVYDEIASAEAAARARKAFDTVCLDPNLHRFKATQHGTMETLRKQSLFVDLFVLARDSATTDLDRGLLTDALVEHKTPTLLLPKTVGGDFPSTVVISWNGQGQTARAIKAATPLLRKASRVVVLEHAGNEVNRSRLEHFLQIEGVKAAQWRDYGDASLTARGRARALLKEAYAEGCDLLVMGAYGYMEDGVFSFGRTTDKVASASEVPVLFCA